MIFKSQTKQAEFESKLNKITFLLNRFNLPNSQFQEEIKLLNSPFLSSSAFTAQLLKKLHHLLILELWETPKEFFTNHQQVSAIQSLLRVLDLNNWLELASKIADPPNYDPLSYELIRKKVNAQMAQIVNFSFLTTNRSHNAREDAPPPDLTPLFQTYLTDLLEQAETYASPLTKRGAAKLREQLDWFRSDRSSGYLTGWLSGQREKVEKGYQRLSEILRRQVPLWKKKKKRESAGAEPPTNSIN